jgi:hypothetical protein
LTVPGSVRDFWFTALKGRVGTAEHLKPWQDAAAKLRADPQAEVVIADPEPPLPAPTSVHVIPMVAAALEQRRAHEAEQAQSETPPEAAA